MSSIDAEEINKFSALAADWWNPKGPMRPLHAMNPLRVSWIDEQIAARLGPNIRLLDLGCGAGLAAEALARRGHDVLGLDASAPAIEAARAHAAGQDLALAYRAGSAEELLAEGAQFDAVSALEVIEHVEDQAGFVALLAGLSRPGGMVFISTMNRTLRSLAVAKIGAEYVARVLPAGTHDWRKFIAPEALAAQGRRAGLLLRGLTGMVMHPVSGGWRASPDVSINYLAAFERID